MAIEREDEGEDEGESDKEETERGDWRWNGDERTSSARQSAERALGREAEKTRRRGHWAGKETWGSGQWSSRVGVKRAAMAP